MGGPLLGPPSHSVDSGESCPHHPRQGGRPMGEILGLGITHYPPLCYKGNMTSRIKLLLADPLLPEHLSSIDKWHPTMRAQWSNDEGQAHSDKHRGDLIHNFRKARAELDAFRPDFVLLWG